MVFFGETSGVIGRTSGILWRDEWRNLSISRFQVHLAAVSVRTQVPYRTVPACTELWRPQVHQQSVVKKHRLGALVTSSPKTRTTYRSSQGLSERPHVSALRNPANRPVSTRTRHDVEVNPNREPAAHISSVVSQSKSSSYDNVLQNNM